MKIYTLKELEKILPIKERTIFKYLKLGVLTGSRARDKGKWLFTEKDIKKFLQRGRKKPLHKK